MSLKSLSLEHLVKVSPRESGSLDASDSEKLVFDRRSIAVWDGIELTLQCLDVHQRARVIRRMLRDMANCTASTI